MTRPGVKSASRVLEVLELFSARRRPLRLHEIYDALGYPQSSATSLMRSMVDTGYVNYCRSTRTYLPTEKIVALGQWLPGFLYGQARHDALIEAVCDVTGETVALCAQNDLFIQYSIIRTPARDHIDPPPQGSMRPMCQSTSGMALMSCLPDRHVGKLCRNLNFYHRAGKPPLEIPAILKELRWVRQIGYCSDDRPSGRAVSTIAFPLHDTLHGIPLALGIAGPRDRVRRNKMRIVADVFRAIEAFKAGRGEVNRSPFTPVIPVEAGIDSR